MKKILLSIALLATLNINAQLVVDSLGRVGIGTDSVKSNLAVRTAGTGDVVAYFNATGFSTGAYTVNFTNTDSVLTSGYYSRVRNSIGHCFGVRGYAEGANSSSVFQRVIGTGGLAGNAQTAVGVFGGRVLSGNPVNYAGVFGAETKSVPYFANYSDRYAGFFYGKVRVTNGIYATVLSPTASSSPLGQGGTILLSDRGESVTDKLSHVQTLQFLRYNPSKTTEVKQATIPVLKDKNLDKMSPAELDAHEGIIDEEPEQYLSPIQYGLDADQLKAVYPELVYEDANGNVSINYVEMVPLLVQSINELKAELAELKGTSSKKAKTKSETTAIEETTSDVDMVRMDQNKPNPFSESTVITLNIPRETQSATIFIYDMSGKQVQSLPVAERGVTDITVYARDLSAGMYIYTLVVDGKLKVTRRMIVSEV